MSTIPVFACQRGRRGLPRLVRYIARPNRSTSKRAARKGSRAAAESAWLEITAAPVEPLPAVEPVRHDPVRIPRRKPAPVVAEPKQIDLEDWLAEHARVEPIAEPARLPRLFATPGASPLWRLALVDDAIEIATTPTPIATTPTPIANTPTPIAPARLPTNAPGKFFLFSIRPPKHNFAIIETSAVA